MRSSLCAALDRHAEERADRLALRFLHHGEPGGPATELTFAAFRARALRVAAALQERLRPGDRALLLYEGGLDFIIAFHGCLYAGVIAVPTYPPDPSRIQRTLPRLQAIAENAGATLVLTTSDLQRAAEPLSAQAEHLAALVWLPTDALEHDPAAFRPPLVRPGDVAYLQYTSGSTGTPKGVMISHDNLAWSCDDFFMRWPYDGPCHQVSWLPTFHDLGLIWGLLTPLFGGFPVTFMLPSAFLQRPARWLEAITHAGGTHTAAPNFAYDLCVHKIGDDVLPRLRLSSLRAAMNAAEPVRPSTLEAFRRRFGPVGLRAEALCPAYGLAEATLQVTLAGPEAPPSLLPVSVRALEQHRIAPPEGRADTRVLVGCGQVTSSPRTAIVEPDTHLRLGDGRVGEIWVAGPGLALGYWGRAEATAGTFDAHIQGEDAAPWLRTGDLGFVAGGELFLSGRAKDLLIIRGRNLYPQDLELEVERAHPAVRPGCVAAFPMEVDGEERVGLVAEIDPARLAGAPPEALLQPLRLAIAEGFEVQIHDLALIPPRGIFKTSSGKIQRRRTAAALATGELTVLARWTTPLPATPPLAGEPTLAGADIEARIWGWLKQAAGIVPTGAGARDVPFQELGLDSVSAVEISGRIAEALGRPTSATLLFTCPNVAALSEHIRRQLGGRSGGEPATAPPRRGPAETEPLAVVGMGCRFPGGGTSPESYWQALKNKVDGVREAGERWPEERDARQRPELRWAGLLDAVDGFDAAFFGISPREAVSLDPQQRLLLEVAWEALEDAGLPPDQLTGSPTGVFVGIANLDHGRMLAERDDRVDMYTLTGNLMSTAAGRISYTLGLQGPCIAVDTACSASLVAIHLACQSLRRGESSVALAGGVNLILSPWPTLLMAAAQAVSPDGRCKTFDASADGMVRAEGCGLVVLKRLSDARRDGDRIWALVRGSAVNQDGRSAGLTAPSGLAQRALLRAALDDAGVSPAQVGYLETHGTGTSLGDPIEVEALKEVLGQPRADGSFCVLGAVKSNLGHLESAAGAAGFIKAALALHHGSIPANLHFRTLNPRISLQGTPFVIPVDEVPWPSTGAPRFAGVSSFGISGTNAHVVLEEAPPAPETAPVVADRAWILPLSARSPAALQALLEAYRTWLTAPSTAADLRMDEIARSASLRRSHHEHRAAVVGRSAQEWAEAIGLARADAPSEESPGPGGAPGAVRPAVVFVLAGHGSQWVGMGRQLLQEEPVFRASIAACDAAIRREAGWSVLEELLSDSGATSLDRLDILQPLLFAMQVALAALWRSWGVEPDAVVGHSLGEVAAAHLAGALSLTQAARIICCRSELLMRIKGQGVMALVELGLDEAEQAISSHRDRLSVAVSNGPAATVLSGSPEAMEEVLAQLLSRGVGCRRLKWAVAAGHSPQVDALLPDFRAALAGLAPGPAQIKLYSTVTAGEIDGAALDAGYWLRNVREPVKFSRTIRRMLDEEYNLFIEISPHPILVTAMVEALDEAGRRGAALPSLRRQKEERRCLLESLATLYVRGGAPDWRRLHPGAGRSVRLPMVPWQRKRYWFADGAAGSAAVRPRRALAAGREGHPLLGPGLTSSVQPESHFWEQQVSVEVLPYLSDHRVQGEVVFPGAGYIEMALAAAAEVYGDGAHALTELRFEQMLALPEGEARTVQSVLVEEGPERASFRVSSRAGEGWSRHAVASLQRARGDAPDSHAPETPRQIQERCVTHLSGDEHRRQRQEGGAPHGPAFQGLAELWLGPGEALGRVVPPRAIAAQTAAYRFHPGFLDSCLQVMTGLLSAPVPDRAALLLPTRLSRLRLCSPPGQEVWVHARLRPPAEGDAGAITSDLVIMDAEAKVVAEVSGLRVQALEPGESAGRGAPEDWLYLRQWQRLAETSPVPPEAAKGAFWVLMDRGQTGAALAALLESRGHRCVRVIAGPCQARIEPGLHQVDPRDPAAFQRLLKEEGREGEPCIGVVHLWSLDAAPLAATTPETLEADQSTGCISALHLAQALLGAGWRRPPRLHLVTRGAQAVGPPAQGVSVAQAPLWGLGRVIGVELPELRCRCVDLDPAPSEHEARGLLGELLLDDREDQVALRGEGRYVARLVKTTFAATEAEAAAALEPARGRPFRLEIHAPGVLDRLALYEAPGRANPPERARPPGPGEVEIEVEAAGLNFKDVLSALGLIPAELVGSQASGPPLGGECAGRIVALGEGVEGLREGQEVLALCAGGGAIGSFVTTSHLFVVARPAELTFAQAATIPVVYLTACHALARVGQLGKGERVLIHAGAGGVGMAAIQYAQHIGAEIFATAGSAEKRDFLRSLGVPHVMDSRSLAFVDEVRRLTSGEGVDVVLNSLSGEAIPASLGLLRRHGRFVEIGVRDSVQNSKIGLKPFLNNLSFTLVELVHLALDRPALVAGLLREIMSLFAAGVFRPLPCRSFPISRAAEAFEHMAKARHIGKIALSLRDPEAQIVPAAPGSAEIRADGSYLITGGLGGLGLGLARWLVERGARHLLLVGRSGPSVEAQKSIAVLEQLGARVVTARADVVRRQEVTALLEDMGSRLPALRGIIHAAAVLDDGTLLELDAAKFLRPLAPKMLGAWNLHALTLDQPLDFFVLYSSAALLLGSPGQASYVAGNAFLEALSQHRRSLGRCAMSIDWGVFSEAGGAAARSNRGERLATRGLGSLTPAQGQDVLGRLLQRGRAQIGVMDFDVEAWTTCYPSEATSPFLSGLIAGRDRPEAGAKEASRFLAAFEATRPEERPALLERHLAEQLGRVLRLDAAEFEPWTSFAGLGLDSLMNLELRNRLFASLGLKLSATLLAAHPTVAALAAHLLGQLGAEPRSRAAGRGADELHADAVLDPAVCPPRIWQGPEGPPTRLLLTGATGFLGAFLLSELLEQTSCEIVCLVRAPDHARGHARLCQALARHERMRPEHARRLVPLVGDLAQPLLGLSESAFDELAGGVDEIYHNGAVVDWHDSYASLRAANVLGTQEILRLGARRRVKPVHHISSLATLAPLMAAGGVLLESDEPDWQERDFDLLSSGYVQSKWVAERKVLLARDRGLPVTVYRPGLITGDSQTGAWVAPDFFYDLIKGCIQLGLAPAWNAAVGMVAADIEAQAIVHIARAQGCQGKTFHVLGQLGHEGEPELDYAGLWAHLRRRGYPLEVVPHGVFSRALEKAIAAGRDIALRSYTHHLRAAIFSAARKLELDCRGAREFLRQADLQPCSAERLLETYVDQMERSGFLAPGGR